MVFDFMLQAEENDRLLGSKLRTTLKRIRDNLIIQDVYGPDGNLIISEDRHDKVGIVM